MEYLKVTKGLIYVILSLAFLFQVQDSIVKFLRGRTTMSRTRIPAPKQIIPVLSICPRFKNSSYKDLWLVSFFDMNPHKGNNKD